MKRPTPRKLFLGCLRKKTIDMRKWYKFIPDETAFKRGYIEKDESYLDHAQAMGGYAADEAYRSKADFFKKYFFNFQLSRLEYYDIFLKKYLKKTEGILSVGSGRAVNELRLIEEGYRITCSDIAIVDSYKQARSLFGDFKYLKYNVLEGPAPEKYDGVMALSLIYLFNNEKLERFFENISASLKSRGHLILDSAGSPDNSLSYFVHDTILKYEAKLKCVIKQISERKRYKIVTKKFGYRRKDEEIIDAASKANFELAGCERYAYLTDFKRSCILRGMIQYCPFCKNVLGYFGKRIPYIRMFNFRKRG